MRPLTGCLVDGAVMAALPGGAGYGLYAYQSGDHGAELGDEAAAIAAKEITRVTWTMEPQVIAWAAGHDPAGGGSNGIDVRGMTGRLDSWSPRSTMTLDIEVTVDYPANGALFGPTWEAGTSVRCYALTLDRYGVDRTRSVHCKDRPALNLVDPGSRERLSSITAADVCLLLTIQPDGTRSGWAPLREVGDDCRVGLAFLPPD